MKIKTPLVLVYNEEPAAGRLQHPYKSNNQPKTLPSLQRKIYDTTKNVVS
jgi:hypothetical protein